MKLTAMVARKDMWQLVLNSAQRQTERRRIMGRTKNRHPLKTEQVYQYVLSHLRDGWSPEQICGRLERETGGRLLHHETVYRFIYKVENKNLRLFEYLPWKRKCRKKKLGRQSQRVRILNRVSIHLRPGEIEQRVAFGHWEGDTVIGKQERSVSIHTEVERKTRYVRHG